MLVSLLLWILVVMKGQDEGGRRLGEVLASRGVSLAPIFHHRLALLREVCLAEEVVEVADNKSRRWAGATMGIPRWFLQPSHQLAMCHTGKHGSTTWAR